MRVAYVHLPRFPIQRRVTETPSLQGRAFALVEEVRGAKRVAFVSDAAGRFGARSGMTVTEATALCPDLLAVPYAVEDEDRALSSLGEALMTLGPAFQISPPDGIWLDASAAGLCKGEAGLLQRVLECCASHGYQGRAVIASELFTARAVARHGSGTVKHPAVSRGDDGAGPSRERANGARTQPAGGGQDAAGPSRERGSGARTPQTDGSQDAAGPSRERGSGARTLQTDGSQDAPGRGPETRSGARTTEEGGATALEPSWTCGRSPTPSLRRPEATRDHAVTASSPVRTWVIDAGDSVAALAAVPIAALDGTVTVLAASLRSLGLTTLGEVAALPAGAVVARLGAQGMTAHQLSRGEDDRVLVPAPVAEVLEETVALDWPAESVEPLLFALKTALDRTCARLSGRQRAAVRLTLRLRLDPSGDRPVGLTLARPTAQAKLLLDLAKHRISDLTLENPVAGLTVRVDEHCEDRGQQLSLGDGPQGDAALEVVLARLSTALGEDALFSAEVEAWHRPESAYTPRPFRPQERPRGLLAELQQERGTGATVDAAFLERPSRVFAQVAQLEAFVDGRGVISAARVLGRRREVKSVSGPERLCGDWWGAEPYSRDYFRVQFDGLGPAWVFRDARDGRFYLHGMFD